MKVFASSRRTIMSGEVVTFATGFVGTDPTGPFEVSASRDAVIVHAANLENHEHLAAFEKAMAAARDAKERLYVAGYGAKSLYKSEPTEVAQ